MNLLYVKMLVEADAYLCSGVQRVKTKFAPDWKINKVDFTLKSLYFFQQLNRSFPSCVLGPVDMKVGDPR